MDIYMTINIVKGKWVYEDREEKNPTNSKYGNVKSGWYDINGKRMYFRSKWEANYALYLDFLKSKGKIKGWKFEPEVFIFEKIRSGTRAYKPDFKIYNNNGTFYYDEVKGHMDAKSLTKLKRMKKYYPDITVNLVDGACYKSIKDNLGKMLKFY